MSVKSKLAAQIKDGAPPERDHAADERARWLAVYGAAYARLFVDFVAKSAGRDEITAGDVADIVGAAEEVANGEAAGRAAWEAEQVRKLDAPETGDYCDE